MPIPEFLTFTHITKIASLLVSLSNNSPLKKVALGEYNMAAYVLQNIQDEQDLRETLNRSLTHLESAYIHYTPYITTWDIWDQYNALHGKKSFANTLCIYISIIHYVLGNVVASKKWLLENLDSGGSIDFPKEMIICLSLKSEDSFYKTVCGEDFCKFERIRTCSLQRYQASLDEVDKYDGYGFNDGSLYSGG